MLERRYLDDLRVIYELLEECIWEIDHKTCRCWALMAKKLIRQVINNDYGVEGFSLKKYLLYKSIGDSLGEVILLSLREKGGEASRRELAAEIKELFPRFSGKSVSDVSNLLSNALESLRSRGLIANVRRGVWALTPKGEREAEKLDWETVIETISPELVVSVH